MSSENPAPVRLSLGSDIRSDGSPARWRRALQPIAVATIATLAGCALPYVAHVSYGQARILIGRVSIEDRLEDPAVSAREKAKLRLVLDAKSFAQTELGLSPSASYASVYDTEGDPVAWNLSACADDAFAPFRWDFPVLGSLPYKGYFTRAPAVAEAAELQARHMDVLLWPVSAYSTLGWFADPLYTPMLEYSDVHLANTIFHELAHATIFIERDADFNETLATFVGNQGSVEYFEARGGPDDPRLHAAADEDHDDKIFAQELAALRTQLTELYTAARSRPEKLAEKKRIFDDFRRRYTQAIRPKLKTRQYDYVATEDLNNAWILAVERYHADLEVFAKLHRKLGSRLRVTVEKLREVAKSKDPKATLAAMAKD